MNNQNDTVVIVDPFSTASGLVNELSDSGYRVTAVITTEPTPEQQKKISQSNFSEVFYAIDDIDLLLEKLQSQSVTAVIPGTDMVVHTADLLAEGCGAPGNNPSTSAARYDKGAMMQALRAVGVAAPATLKTRSFSEASQWARECDSWPIILKPSHSAGCDGVTFCADEEALQKAWREVAQKRNFYGYLNEDIVLQECLQGEQYACNSVSVNGVHYIQSVWREQMFSTTDGVRKIEHTAHLLAPDAPRVQEIMQYTRDVLDAVQLRNGPADCEIMWCENGPRLIEINPRLMGGSTSEAECAAVGESHLTATVRSILDPESVTSQNTYPHQRELMWVVLSAPYDAVISEDAFQELRSLPTLHSVRLNTRRDGTLAHTDVFARLAGDVFLIADTHGAVQRDAERVREIETRLYSAI